MIAQTVPSKLPRVNVYIDPNLKDKGEKLAKKRFRSLSNLLAVFYSIPEGSKPV